MPWMKWLPWRFVVRRLARAHGFLDPMVLMARLQHFAQPSEVNEPIELLRAGAVFHARGLINSRVVQHNLDWVWPYWIERQFNPADEAFVARAFSITHVNLTNRNWTAIGHPDCPELPIVDPRGLLTPFFDSWSLDGWVLSDDGRRLLPSRAEAVRQSLDLDDGLAVTTRTEENGLRLTSRAFVEPVDGVPCCCLELEAQADKPGWLVLALRPYNPEGISFIHRVQLDADRMGWRVDDAPRLTFSAPAERHHISDYRSGDVAIHLRELADETAGLCQVGMVTAAAMFRLEADVPRSIAGRMALPPAKPASPARRRGTWRDALAGHCALSGADERTQFLYEAALRSLVLHSSEEVYPGPYTYKRFWFRDAAFIIHGLLCAGLTQRAREALDRFPPRQTPLGYFYSQAGEWDANGEALWIMRRYCELANCAPPQAWLKAVERGARWIMNKRLPDKPDSPHAGLLPAGFSAEHLGPNDYYYWDDFWGIAGLEAAADLFERTGRPDLRDRFRRDAETFRQAVDASLAGLAQRLGRPAMAASPHRRLDSGAVGSLAVGYPLQLCPPHDPRLLDTVEFLLGNCFFRGGFFQDMIHSGINPYLTLHVAQVLLRAGDRRALQLIETVAGLASPTGQWPEAVHPRTGGGCMGDGQHVWAAAEWLLMIRNCLVREEADRLVLGAGLQERWLDDGGCVDFGPAPTRFGPVSLRFEARGRGTGHRVQVSWQADWHAGEPAIEIRLPGYEAANASAGRQAVELVPASVP